LMFVTRAPDRMSWRIACIAAPTQGLALFEALDYLTQTAF